MASVTRWSSALTATTLTESTRIKQQDPEIGAYSLFQERAAAKAAEIDKLAKPAIHPRSPGSIAIKGVMVTRDVRLPRARDS